MPKHTIKSPFCIPFVLRVPAIFTALVKFETLGKEKDFRCQYFAYCFRVSYLISLQVSKTLVSEKHKETLSFIHKIPSCIKSLDLSHDR